MRQPLWILNSSLLLIFLVGQFLLFVLQKTVPARVNIEPGSARVVEKDVISSVDIAVIYKNDLFNTYVSPQPIFDKQDDAIEAIPEMPKAIEITIPSEKTPVFFAPLDVTLKGIIFVSDDPSSSLAIIQDKKSKEEQNYQVGDLIEDAQILKILANRVIVIRSNGQQETLYLREEDAEHEFATEISYLPKDVVEHQHGNQYQINIDEFVKRIDNLGEFINLLDLTTVYRQGKSIGSRVGKISKDSLGSMLGFNYDDIILAVDTLESTDLQHRTAIYDHVLQKKAGDTITVDVERGSNHINLQYALIDSSMKKAGLTTQEILEVSDSDIKSEVESGKDKNSDKQQVSKKSTSSNLGKEYSSASLKESKSSLPTLDQKTLHDLEAHRKRLLAQRENMAPTLNQIEFEERRKASHGGSRNVIMDGMKK